MLPSQSFFLQSKQMEARSGEYGRRAIAFQPKELMTSEKVSRWVCLWASVSCLGTHPAHTLKYSRESTIFTALPALSPNDLAISSISMRLFYLTDASARSILEKLWAIDDLHSTPSWPIAKLAFTRFFQSIIALLDTCHHCAVVYRIVTIHLVHFSAYAKSCFSFRQ